MAELFIHTSDKTECNSKKIHLTFLFDFGTYVSRQENCTGVVECLRAVRCLEDLLGSFRRNFDVLLFMLDF